jgi:hypothetical protein
LYHLTDRCKGVCLTNPGEKALQLYDEGFRPRGRRTPAECLLELALEEQAGTPRGSIAAYARAWRVTWRLARRILEAYDAQNSAHTENEPHEADLAPPAQPSQQGLPGVPQKTSPIVYLLPDTDGVGRPIGADEKLAWWESERAGVRADAEAEAAKHGVTDRQARAAIFRSTAIRYFKRYLAGERRFRGVAERKALIDTAQAYFSREPDPADLPEGDRPSRRLRHVEA